jgi:hypothetical protein
MDWTLASARVTESGECKIRGTGLLRLVGFFELLVEEAELDIDGV